MATVAGGDFVAAGDPNGLDARIALLEAPLMTVLKHSVAQNVATGGAVLTFDTELLDVPNWHNPASNPTRVTPTINGWYQCIGSVQFASNATLGRRAAAVRVNGVTLYYGQVTPNTATAGNMGAFVVANLPLNGAGDYVELYGYQDTGGALAIGDVQSTRFSVQLMYKL